MGRKDMYEVEREDIKERMNKAQSGFLTKTSKLANLMVRQSKEKRESTATNIGGKVIDIT